METCKLVFLLPYSLCDCFQATFFKVLYLIFKSTGKWQKEMPVFYHLLKSMEVKALSIYGFNFRLRCNTVT